MKVFSPSKKGITILLFLLVGALLGAQSDRETAYRNRLLADWARDGIVPVTTTGADGTQSLAVLAYGWYFPLSYTAKAGVPSVLRIYTNKTYDCSRAFLIPELRVRKNLPATGVVEIPIPAKKKGETLFGTCSMGMYTFNIKFE